MATQTVQPIRAASGRTATAKLFTFGNDAVVASVAATEATNRKGTYLAAFTDVTPGEYEVILIDDATGVNLAHYWVTIGAATGNYDTYTRVDKPGITRSTWAALTVDHTSTGSFGYVIGLFFGLIENVTGWRFTAKALEQGPTGPADTGARSVTVTVTLGGNPLQGATVRLSKGAENKVKATNSSGQAAFNCDDGTWTVAISAANASFAGATLVVDGTETPTYAMTADSITPSSPTLVTGYWVCYDQLGAVETGVTISAKCVKVPTAKGFALDTATRTATSGAGGLAQFTNLIPGATYEIWRGTGLKHTIKIADDATGSVTLNSILGT